MNDSTDAVRYLYLARAPGCKARRFWNHERNEIHENGKRLGAEFEKRPAFALASLFRLFRFFRGSKIFFPVRKSRGL